MGQAEKYVEPALAAIIFVAVTLFFGILYPYHIYHQEQFQLFEWTAGYFLTVSSVPGGFADWVGRFLTQFFIFSWAGAAITGSLVTTIYLLVCRVARGKSPVSRILMIVPAAAFSVFLTDERALAGALVAVVLTLGAVCAARAIRNDKGRSVFVVAATPLFYWICGPVAVLLPLLEARDVHPAAFVCALALAVITPLASSCVLHYGLKSLMTGVHYFRYVTVVPVFLWIAVLITVIFCHLPDIRIKNGTIGTLLASACLIAVISIWVSTVRRTADFTKEELMAYDYMSRFQQWDDIVGKAGEKQPDRPISVSCLNLALSQTGRLPDEMFSFYQNGTAGLFPAFSRVFTTPLSTAEIFWHLGLINAAQHFTFEAQEAIPDFQKSGRCYRRLAQTNLVNGDYAVAGKYLNTLSHTLFYRNWALSTAKMLGDENAIAGHPLYGKLRILRCHEKDNWFKDTAVDSVLLDIAAEHPDCEPVREYILAWYLLDCNLDAFVKHFDSGRQSPAARAYQEAYLMYMLEHQLPIENTPPFVETATAERFRRFIKDVQKGQAQAFITRTYGDTYWYYALYRR
ncbi:MAG: hypothetical protein KBS73_05740 [Bacteroidales bacterium]|nr:hypothetical protein [Candidatus Cacconaster equifaecalis]